MLYEVLQQLLCPCKTSYVPCCGIRGYFAASLVHAKPRNWSTGIATILFINRAKENKFK